MSVMQNIVERIWTAPWPELLAKTVPGQFDLILNISDSPCDTIDLQKPGGLLRHMWIPFLGVVDDGYGPYFAVSKILDAYRGKQILIYSSRSDSRVPLPVWSWIVRQRLQEASFPRDAERRAAEIARWVSEISLLEGEGGALPYRLLEVLEASSESPERGLSQILEGFVPEALSPPEEVGTEPLPEIEPEPEAITVSWKPNYDNFMFCHAHPFGVNVGLIASPLNLVELVGGRAHSQSRMAMASILGINYEPRKGERLEITGPWNPDSRYCDQELWDEQYAAAESKHKTPCCGGKCED